MTMHYNFNYKKYQFAISISKMSCFAQLKITESGLKRKPDTFNLQMAAPALM